MMAPTIGEDDGRSASFPARFQVFLSRLLSTYLDRTTLYPKTRWCCFLVLISLFLCRIYFVQGFFVVTYALGIYLLNLLLAFLSPQIDPETEAYVLPVRETEEYRPFQRRLPEFKFWLQGSKATLVALLATLIPALDLPVFWPILLIYFLMLFFITMKQQIKNMIQHKYIPFSWGKQTYGDITRDRGGTVNKKTRSGPFGKKLGMAFPSMHVKPMSHTRAD